MTSARITDVILNSVIEAFDAYYDMTSKDCWVGRTPEYWYTTNIAISLNKAFPCLSFLLENSVKEFREHSDPRQGRPNDTYRTSGKSDIAIWKCCPTENEWEAISIIEVKRAWGWKKKIHLADVDRICSTLLESNNIKTGYFVIVTDTEDENEKLAKKKIKRKVKKKFKKAISKHIETKEYEGLELNKYIKFSKFYRKDNSIAAVIVYEISTNNIDQAATARLEK